MDIVILSERSESKDLRLLLQCSCFLLSFRSAAEESAVAIAVPVAVVVAVSF